MMMKYFFFFFTLAIFYGCTKDCDDANCLNGGYCDSGFCECPEGFYGEYCEKMLSPTSIKITSIKVDDVIGGYIWDDYLNGPDLYIRILKNNNVVFSSNDTVYNFMMGSGSIFPAFAVEPAYKVEMPITENYLIHVVDYDPQDADDLIDRVGLVLNGLDGKKTEFKVYTGGYSSLTINIEYGF